MTRYFKSINYHARRILFERFAFPEVVNEKISKIILKKYLPVNPIIIDCGAHDGADTVELASLFKSGTIHAFEPVEELFNKLISRENSNHKVIHTEVSTKETYKGVATYEVCRSFLEEKGFNVVLEAIPKGWDMGNVLFVRK